MKALLFYIVLLSCLLNGLPLPAQLQDLSYRLESGETYRLMIELQQETESESMYSDQISLSSRASLLFMVDSITSDGIFHMTVSYRDLMLSLLAPGMGLEISSESGRNPKLTAMADSLELKHFQLSMDRRGQLLYMEGLEELFGSLSADREEQPEEQVIRETLSEAFGVNAVKSLLGLFVNIYPVLPSMTNWTNDVTYYFNTRPVGMINRYTLARQDSDRTIIQGLGMLQSDSAFIETTRMGRVSSLVSGSQTYDIQVDTRSGWPLECLSRQRLLVETTILESKSLPDGLKIPSYTETLFEVTGMKIELE